MAKSWKCTCGASNPNLRQTCDNCGGERPLAGGAPKAPLRCIYDGTQLDALGFCLEGNGFPTSLRCPFACPFCRQPLEWSGACFQCFGTATRRQHDSWAFPGARHETHDDEGQPIGDGQHWVKVLEAGRPVASAAENRVALWTVQELLAAAPVSTDLRL